MKIDWINFSTTRTNKWLFFSLNLLHRISNNKGWINIIFFSIGLKFSLPLMFLISIFSPKVLSKNLLSFFLTSHNLWKLFCSLIIFCHIMSQLYMSIFPIVSFVFSHNYYWLRITMHRHWYCWFHSQRNVNQEVFQPLNLVTSHF